MTHALCIKCGSTKSSALAQCAQCHFEPTEPRDCARSTLLTDRRYSLFELDRIGEALRAGRPVVYDPEEILEYGLTIEAAKPEHKPL